MSTSALRVYRELRMLGHSSPSHISKTVLSVVKIGPPTCMIDRTVFEMWLGSPNVCLGP